MILSLRARSCSEFFFQPVQFDLQLSDLAVEFLSESFFGGMAFFPLVRKNFGKFCQRLFLLADDLVAMHTKLGAMSLIVISPWMAANATLALKSGLNFVRVVPTVPP